MYIFKVAEDTAAANEQHYEVPTEFFECHLGPLNKYSSCEWKNASNIKEAEEHTFESYIEKMNLVELEDKSLQNMIPGDTNRKRMKLLEIGCGWGSFLLYASAKFPSLDFVGFSNSATQIRHIQEEAVRKGLKNLKALKLDINDFCNLEKRSQIQDFQNDSKFQRIISIECLEHRCVSTYYKLCFSQLSKKCKFFSMLSNLIYS